MKLCSIDTTLNEKIPSKSIMKSIDSKVANVRFNVIKKFGGGLDRKILEKSHILFITLPRKKITQEQYIELVSYIEIGGCLVLTLPSPPWTELGRFFEVLRSELGITFESNYVYGLPKIPFKTKLVGSKLLINKAHVIKYQKEPAFLKENGIKGQIPLVLMDNKPVVLAGYKRRGRFIIFSSPEIFSEKNKDFLSRLVRLSVNKKKYGFKKEKGIKIADTNYFLLFQHACLDNYLLSLFHYKYRFYQDVILFSKIEELSEQVYRIISKQKVLGRKPNREEITETLKNLV